jgi:glycosyltransferase involved in cell wall biosynthesis
MPLFSTIIPVYNRADLIRATLDSVLAQELPDQEVIVVDDGSTDETLKALESYGDRIRVFQQKNSGPAVARNLGIRNASGEYIAILDSDDLWFPWTLATYAEAIRQHDSPAFVAGAPAVFHDASELRALSATPLRAEYFSDYLTSGDRWRWFGASSFVLRTDAVRAAGGFSDAWINSDDADLALRLGEARGFLDIQEPATFAYRDHAGSLKSDTAISFRSLSYMIGQEESGGYPGGPARRRERREILTRHVRPFTLACLKSGAFSEGWKLYCRTFGWHVALHRAAYLCGYPAMAAIRRLKNAIA